MLDVVRLLSIDLRYHDYQTPDSAEIEHQPGMVAGIAGTDETSLWSLPS